MNALFFIFLILVSISVFAENRTCNSIIEELKIDPTPSTDGSVRKIQLTGKTDEGEDCEIKFLPDFCSFQLNAPLKIPQMYYLTDTDSSSIKIKFRRGDHFFMRAVTKELNTQNWKKFTKILEMKREGDKHRMIFNWIEGKFIKDQIESFSCLVNKSEQYLTALE